MGTVQLQATYSTAAGSFRGTEAIATIKKVLSQMHL